ncbi:MAG TPA: hypothetical protein PK720_04320 [bacterium]|nr:hypothetical protein [bacterium]
MEVTQDDMDFLHQTLNKSFTKIEKNFQRIEERFKQMDERFEQMNERFNKIEKHLDYHDARFNDLEKRLSEKVDKKDFRTLITVLRAGNVLNRHEADHFLIPIT